MLIKPDLYIIPIKYKHFHDLQIHAQIEQRFGDVMLYEFLFQKLTLIKIFALLL